RFDLGELDISAKPQGAAGLDLDFYTSEGKRVIGEIKTTVPYSGAKGNLGENQNTSINGDFAKLNRTVADHKFFFATDRATYELVTNKYAGESPDIEIVLLTTPPAASDQMR